MMFPESGDAGPPKRHSCSSEFYLPDGSSGSNGVANGPGKTNGCVDKSFGLLPDFSTQINTNFTSFGKNRSNAASGEPIDFSRFVKNNPGSSSSDSLTADYPAAPAAAPSVWALDCSDRFIVLGCSTGRIEVWEIEAGAFQVDPPFTFFEVELLQYQISSFKAGIIHSSLGLAILVLVCEIRVLCAYPKYCTNS